jgi:hypothetical protein
MYHEIAVVVIDRGKPEQNVVAMHSILGALPKGLRAIEELSNSKRNRRFWMVLTAIWLKMKHAHRMTYRAAIRSIALGLPQHPDNYVGEYARVLLDYVSLPGVVFADLQTTRLTPEVAYMLLDMPCVMYVFGGDV